MRNMSNSCPLLVIKASKLLILLSCRGIIVSILSFFLKKKKAQSMGCNSSTGTRPPDLYAFLRHLFKPASHLLLAFTCSTKTSSLRHSKGVFGKYSPKTVLGSDFYIRADLITHSQKASASDVSRGHKQWALTECARHFCCHFVQMRCINRYEGAVMNHFLS